MSRSAKPPGRSDPASLHMPVMAGRVVAGLVTDPDALYIDGTLGMGGHTRALLAALSPKGSIVGFELDTAAYAQVDPLRRELGSRVTFVRGSYAGLPRYLRELHVSQVQGILLDLGLSSFTLEKSGRGFTFRRDEPLDMRFDASRDAPLAERLTIWPQEKITEILQLYGEVRRARGIGAAIAGRARTGAMRTTFDLVEAVGESAKGPEKSKTLARVFQAFRIEINDELRTLETFLGHLPALLVAGGRAAIISFHSLEDRIVKRFLARESVDCICPPKLPICECGHVASMVALNRKPLTPEAEELAANPRSRSAKLRIMERLP